MSDLLKIGWLMKQNWDTRLLSFFKYVLFWCLPNPVLRLGIQKKDQAGVASGLEEHGYSGGWRGGRG